MNEACALSGSSPIVNAPGYAGVPPARSFSLCPAVHASTSIAEGYAGVPPACSFSRALHPFLCRRDAGVPRDGVPRYDPRTTRRGVKSVNQPREPSRDRGMRPSPWSEKHLEPSKASAAGTKPLDSRFLPAFAGMTGNDGNHATRRPFVIPAEAGIQSRERFFVTLHNTSWVREYLSSISITYAQRTCLMNGSRFRGGRYSLVRGAARTPRRAA